MKKTLTQRKPVLVSVLWALLLLAFYILGGVITQVNKMNEINSLLVYGAIIWVSAFVAVIYIWRSDSNFADRGFRTIQKGANISVLYYLPAVIMELVGFAFGFSTVSISFILAVIFFTLAVGFAEEIYFRGLIFKILEVKSIKKAILISSIIFAVTHLCNLIGGADIQYTVIQLIFAFVFGIVVAEVIYLTKSLIPVILWHFLHDCISCIQKVPHINKLGIQAIMLIIYAVYMWNRIKVIDNKHDEAVCL